MIFLEFYSNDLFYSVALVALSCFKHDKKMVAVWARLFKRSTMASDCEGWYLDDNLSKQGMS